MPTPLNVLYIHSHDTGRYIQPYGYAVDSPRLQRLAEEGTLFRKAFCAAPTCSPSRAALLTGQMPHACGQFGLSHLGFELQHRERHLANQLQQAGFRTVLAGMQHVVQDDVAGCGYTEVLPSWQQSDEERVASSVAWLEEHAAAGTPFFLDVGFNATHRPFPQSASGAERYVELPTPVPDTPETRRDMADFHASVRLYDSYVGSILDALSASGAAERTLVICTTDHGAAFPQMKCTLSDHGTGVMLLMRGPADRIVPGQVIDAMVSQIDLYPTLCELLELEAPAWLQGTALTGLLDGSATGEVNEAVYAEITYHAAYEPTRMVRTPRYKYIRDCHNYGRPILANIDPGITKTALCEVGLAEMSIDKERLYDLMLDPAERENLIGQVAQRDVAEMMRDHLEQWMVKSEDPLLSGAVAPPEGARVTEMSAVDPKAPPPAE